MPDLGPDIEDEMPASEAYATSLLIVDTIRSVTLASDGYDAARKSYFRVNVWGAALGPFIAKKKRIAASTDYIKAYDRFAHAYVKAMDVFAENGAYISDEEFKYAEDLGPQIRKAWSDTYITFWASSRRREIKSPADIVL